MGSTGGEVTGGPSTDGWETDGFPTTGDPTGTSGDPGTTDPGTTGTTGNDTEGEPDDHPDPPEETDTDTDTDTDTEGDICDDMNDVTLFLSPDDSNSMSSPVQVREQILEFGDVYNNAPVRTWEFMNYYTFDYPPAEPGKLKLSVELVEAESQGDYPEYLLQISVSSEAMSNEDRAPMNVTFALDESGSMAGTPIELLRDSCRVMAGQLKAGDIVSMVTWDTDNASKLAGYAVEGPNDSTLLDIIDSIEHGGGTDLNGGLVAGYELANISYDPERINRLVLISDGGANVGVTDADLIAENAGDNNSDGIYMVGVGVESGSHYNDKLMDTVTDLGKGASVFIPNKDEAQKVFADNFVNTMAVAARDVRVQLDLPPGFEIVTFSGEEYGTDPSEIEPQHIAPNDSMVFHQRITTCAPGLLEDGLAEIGVTVTYQDATTFEEDVIEQSKSFSDLLAAPSPMLLKGAAIFAYAEAAKAAKSGEEAQAKLSQAQSAVAAAKQALPNDPELDEISNLLDVLSM